MRVVFDTCVWVAAVRSRRGASFALLSELSLGRFRFGISVPLFQEHRSKLLGTAGQGVTPLTQKQVKAILAALAYYCVEVPVYFRLRPNLRDEGDNLVFECAANFGAQAIVTHNVKHFERRELKGYAIRVLRPREFLAEIGRQR
jgi:putative PIN family toxin of toxin-antitoxin system